MIVMISLRVRCPWRTRWCWLLWSRRCRYRGSNHLQKSSISQNIAMSWLIGTSVGFRLHLGGYSHHTWVPLLFQAPRPYPELRLAMVCSTTSLPVRERVASVSPEVLFRTHDVSHAPSSPSEPLILLRLSSCFPLFAWCTT